MRYEAEICQNLETFQLWKVLMKLSFQSLETNGGTDSIK